MLDIISKTEYFDWLEKGIADPSNYSLKGIQDAWILSLLADKSSLKIAEVGGGISRVLQSLSEDNECWNIDKFEGMGAGPKGIPEMENIKVVPLYLGTFDEVLPNEYFDVVFSISVVEHVPVKNLNDFFADCHRILKPGGVMIHAIDLYVEDEPSESMRIVKLYRQSLKEVDFEWFCKPKVNKSITFKSRYASNSDVTMHHWNRIAPILKEKRANSQSVALKLAGFKRNNSGEEVAPDVLVLKELSAKLKAQQLGRKFDQENSAVSSSKSLYREQEKPTILVDKGVAKQTPAHLAATLLRRIARYYSRWPVLVAVVAVLFNTVACFDIVAGLLQWVLVASGTTTLLFLIGHAASKADYVLEELEKIRDAV